MSIPPSPNHFANHTFGRDHFEPPPLPLAVQQSRAGSCAATSGDSAPVVQMHAGNLPHDFDHLVRSVGEW